MRHLDLLQRFPLKTIWMKELAVAGGSEDSQQQPIQKQKIQLLEQGDLFW